MNHLFKKTSLLLCMLFFSSVEILAVQDDKSQPESESMSQRSVVLPASNYVVDLVKVDVKANSVEEAQNQAQILGQRKAFEALLQELLLEKEISIKDVKDEQIADMITNFAPLTAKIENNRYMAEYNVVFDHQKVKDFIVSQGLSISAIKGTPILVLPVGMSGGRYELWGQETLWRQVWVEEINALSQSNLIRASSMLVLPNFDIQDVSTISLDEVLQLERKPMMNLMSRYKSGDLLVVKITDLPERLEAQMIMIKGDGNIESHKISSDEINSAGKTHEQIYHDFINSMVAKVEKRLPENSTEVSQAPSYSYIDVYIPITSLEDWTKIRQAIDKSEFVRQYEYKLLSADLAIVKILYEGGISRLQMNLEQHHVELSFDLREGRTQFSKTTRGTEFNQKATSLEGDSKEENSSNDSTKLGAYVWVLRSKSMLSY